MREQEVGQAAIGTDYEDESSWCDEEVVVIVMVGGGGLFRQVEERTNFLLFSKPASSFVLLQRPSAAQVVPFTGGDEPVSGIQRVAVNDSSESDGSDQIGNGKLQGTSRSNSRDEDDSVLEKGARSMAFRSQKTKGPSHG